MRGASESNVRVTTYVVVDDVLFRNWSVREIALRAAEHLPESERRELRERRISHGDMRFMYVRDIPVC